MEDPEMQASVALEEVQAAAPVPPVPNGPQRQEVQLGPAAAGGLLITTRAATAASMVVVVVRVLAVLLSEATGRRGLLFSHTMDFFLFQTRTTHLPVDISNTIPAPAIRLSRPVIC